MMTYKSTAGEHVSDTVKHMVALANETNEPVLGQFNGVTLTAHPGDDPDTIVRYYQIKLNCRHEEYERSQEMVEWKANRRRDEEYEWSLYVITHMVALANEACGTVTMELKRIELTARPGDDPDTIVRDYQTESNRRHEEYKKWRPVVKSMIALANNKGCSVNARKKLRCAVFTIKPGDDPDTILRYCFDTWHRRGRGGREALSISSKWADATGAIGR